MPRRVLDLTDERGQRWTDPQLSEQLARQQRIEAQKNYVKGSTNLGMNLTKVGAIPAAIAGNVGANMVGLPGRLAEGLPKVMSGEWNPHQEYQNIESGFDVEGSKQRYGEQLGLAQDIAGSQLVSGTVPNAAPSGSLRAGLARDQPKGLLEKSSLATMPHMPVSEMQATQVPTGELAPRKIIQPADLQGRTLIGEQSDRTQAGHTLTHIGGKKLAFPVDLEGGMNFTRAGASQGPDEAIWASDLGQINRINKFARSIEEETGKPGIVVPAAMNPRGGDFSTMHADAILAQLPNAKITRDTLKDFDKRMRALHPNTWGTLTKPEELGLQFREPNMGNLRKDFVEQASLDRFTQKGFPDPGQTRFAAHDPDLLGLPTGASGHTFAELKPGAPTITNPAMPHGTYPAQTPGTYLGGFERPVPFEMMWPDLVAGRRAAGLPQASDWRSFQVGNVQQPVNQMLVDNLSQYLEQARKGGP